MRETAVFIEGKNGATNFFSTTEAIELHRKAAEAAEFIDTIREVTDATVNGTLRVLAGLGDESDVRQIATRLLQNVMSYHNGQPVIREDLHVARLPYLDGENRMTALFDYHVGLVTQIDCLADGGEITVLLLSPIQRVDGPRDVSGVGWHFTFDSTDDRVIFARNPAKDERTFRDMGSLVVGGFDMNRKILISPIVGVHLWVAPGGLSAS